MTMMPRLRAERNLEAVRILQVGGGQFEKGSEGMRGAEATLDEWSEAAVGDSSVKESPQQVKEQRQAARQALGDIGVKIIQKERSDDEQS